MEKYETAVAVFPNHEAAERAVKSFDRGRVRNEKS